MSLATKYIDGAFSIETAWGVLRGCMATTDSYAGGWAYHDTNISIGELSTLRAVEN